MDNDSSNQPLKWTRRKHIGVSTYYTNATAGNDTWTFAIDKPYRDWVIRGWADGRLSYYHEAPTLVLAKAQVAVFVRKGCRK